jgi:hypothetical protein
MAWHAAWSHVARSARLGAARRGSSGVLLCFACDAAWCAPLAVFETKLLAAMLLQVHTFRCCVCATAVYGLRRPLALQPSLS